eukprot:CAMPEP_0181137312 /NCGR_PEP_ID=MMETSP1071-20121207/33642_1 /TAXON_ID=35127 /ORGANISM="Thalassiosira sp., Strain NH16" /LENGTH=485 /DNA_ID=CAMNT_0023224065 /DNA_START=114 /DNA_END=1572 /DNA_ORIENTATION=-
MIPEDEESVITKPSTLQTEMSFATRRYAGKKGYLDEDDKFVRKYDKDGDGDLDLEEVKAMARDLRTTISSKKILTKVIIAMAVFSVVSLMGNFGLTFVTVILTKQVHTQNGDLTDTGGNMLATKSKGVSGTFYPEFQVWDDHTHSVPEVIDFQFDDVSHSLAVKLSTQQLGATDENDVNGTCDVYDDIEVEGVPDKRKVKCCGVATEPCDVFRQIEARALQGKCFSPMSTVIEQTKGKMLVKDLKFGDSVLAANQVFQPIVVDIHSHPSKHTEFIQVHTKLSDNDPKTSPIELTSGHLIFIQGKDMPIPASEVELGDSLFGTSGPTKVTNITTVMRDGIFTPLTGDATLYVDGVLASSVGDNPGEVYLYFGPLKLHTHIFVSRVVAPLILSLCNNVASKHCETHVDDGDGGKKNNLILSGEVLLKKSPLIQGLGVFSLVAAGAISLFGYYAIMGLAPIAFVLSVFMALDIAKKLLSAKPYKNKVA